MQFKMLAALVGAIVSIAGVWFAGVRRGDKADARILALEETVKAETESRKDAHEAVMAKITTVKARVQKLRDWQQREIGKSERSDVRALPSNPGDTRG